MSFFTLLSAVTASISAIGARWEAVAIGCAWMVYFGMEDIRKTVVEGRGEVEYGE